MECFANLKQLTSSARPAYGLRAGLQKALRDIEVNWYQVAVVTVATFAISMDLMFPPVRVATAQGLGIYAGHAHMLPVEAGTVQVDFAWLAVELVLIVAGAVVGWCIGTPKSEQRQSTRDPVNFH